MEKRPVNSYRPLICVCSKKTLLLFNQSPSTTCHPCCVHVGTHTKEMTQCAPKSSVTLASPPPSACLCPYESAAMPPQNLPALSPPKAAAVAKPLFTVPKPALVGSTPPNTPTTPHLMPQPTPYAMAWCNLSAVAPKPSLAWPKAGTFQTTTKPIPSICAKA